MPEQEEVAEAEAELHQQQQRMVDVEMEHFPLEEQAEEVTRKLGTAKEEEVEEERRKR